MNGAPSGIVPTSITRAMCSFLSRTVDCASRRNRCTVEGLSAICGSRILIATDCARYWCDARTTRPIPPVPMISSIRYLPSKTVPGVSSTPAILAGYFMHSGAIFVNSSTMTLFWLRHMSFI